MKNRGSMPEIISPIFTMYAHYPFTWTLLRNCRFATITSGDFTVMTRANEDNTQLVIFYGTNDNSCYNSPLCYLRTSPYKIQTQLMVK